MEKHSDSRKPHDYGDTYFSMRPRAKRADAGHEDDDLSSLIAGHRVTHPNVAQRMKTTNGISNNDIPDAEKWSRNNIHSMLNKTIQHKSLTSEDILGINTKLNHDTEELALTVEDIKAINQELEDNASQQQQSSRKQKRELGARALNLKENKNYLEVRVSRISGYGDNSSVSYDEILEAQAATVNQFVYTDIGDGQLILDVLHDEAITLAENDAVELKLPTK